MKSWVIESPRVSSAAFQHSLHGAVFGIAVFLIGRAVDVWSCCVGSACENVVTQWLPVVCVHI